MTSSLFEQTERAKAEIENRLSVKFVVRSGSLDSYPDLFELWTLFNVVKAIAGDEEGELYSTNSHMEGNIVDIVAGDVHPAGKIRGGTIELVGMGMAPTLTFSSHRLNTSIWYDKYVGVSIDGRYWPRPDIAIRSGAYDVVKSVRFETRAETKAYEGGYEVRRGRIDSETIKGWRSLSELVQGDPHLKEHSNELVHNFKITKDVFSVVSIDSEETVAAAGRPSEAIHSDDSEHVYGEVKCDDGVIPWARKKSFTQPNIIIECKSGLLTPHAVDQLIIYKRLFYASNMIVTTTRLLDQIALTKLRTHGIQLISPPASLGKDYAFALAEKLREVRESS
nr:hypothetical protein [Candidatus Njordarchaeota archaeon]